MSAGDYTTMFYSRRSFLWICPFLLTLFAKGSFTTLAVDTLKFVDEPPYHQEFSNSTGTELKCSAAGTPPITVSWISSDGNEVKDVNGLRRVNADGTLLFLPFRAEDYRQDVHSMKYRCVLANDFGSIISREVHVHAVMDQPFEPHVYDAFATYGSVAVLKCAVSGMMAKYTKVIAWIKDNSQKITTSYFDDKKFIVATSGDLLVSNVRLEDAGSTYRCQVKHHLSGEIKTSGSSGKLFVTEPQGSVPSKILPIATTFSPAIGSQIALPCVVQGYPIPLVTWYKTGEDRTLSEVVSSDRVKFTKIALIIDNVQEIDAGQYICMAENSMGTDKLEISLNILQHLVVTVKPKLIILETNQVQEMQCVIEGAKSSILWYKNGNMLPMSSIPFQQFVNESGFYQCFAINEQEMIHDTTTVVSGVLKPNIVTGFDEKFVEPGSSITLKCKVVGNPLPKLNWYVDNKSLSQSEKIIIQERKISSDTVSSEVKLLDAKVENGGLYKCEAYVNGDVTYFVNRVNVYGPLHIRQMTPKTVVSGKAFEITCPFYGYPYNKIQWEKDGTKLPSLFHQTTFTNGTLIVNKVKKGTDDGIYTCVVSNIQGQIATGSVNVTVMTSPKIMPFSFQEELLREGMRARLQCVVSEGDSPIKIEWFKDNVKISSDLGINVRNLDEFSSILNIGSVNPKHNGNYTCKATNEAATVMHTAKLNVNGNGL